MPFTPTPDLPPNPALRVFFSGLLILDPSADAKACEVFVNHSASQHHLTIEVRRKRPNRPDEFMMRHVGPLAFATTVPGAASPPGPVSRLPLHGFIIQKRTTDAGGAALPNVPEGIRRYDPAEPPAQGEPESLSLAVNLEEFHDGNPVVDKVVVDPEADPPVVRDLNLLDVDPLGGRPSILINDGVFYTAAKTRDDIDITLQKKDNPDQPLAPFASLIGANIYLDDANQFVEVRWRNQGRLETLTLRKPEPGVSYEIYIVNDPLFENDSLEEPKHDEFREYYKILPNVETSKQFRLKVTPPPASAPRGTTRTPCMSVLKSI